MRRKNNYLVAVANNGKLRQRFTPGVPRTFDQDCRKIKFLAGKIYYNFSQEGNAGKGRECISKLIFCISTRQILTLFMKVYSNAASFP